MARGHDSTDRRATREVESDADSEAVESTAGGQVGDESHPRSELRWVQIRRPRATAEIGRNGRILDRYYHAGYDAWEVLLETYEGERSE
jgi:hypothetical protein